MLHNVKNVSWDSPSVFWVADAAAAAADSATNIQVHKLFTSHIYNIVYSYFFFINICYRFCMCVFV